MVFVNWGLCEYAKKECVSKEEEESGSNKVVCHVEVLVERHTNV